MNCFCGMVDRWKAFRLISSRDRCQRSSPSRISDTPWAGFGPVQDLSSGLIEWSHAVMITTTPRRQIWRLTFLLFLLVLKPVVPLYRKWRSSSIKHPLSFLVQLHYFKFATVGWGVFVNRRARTTQRIYWNFAVCLQDTICLTDELPWVEYNLNIIACSLLPC